MRTRIATIAVSALAFSALAVAPASADHLVGPCDEAQAPGAPGYAKHHIVPAAHAGVLGQGHKPGSHQGFSACLGVHD